MKRIARLVAAAALAAAASVAVPLPAATAATCSSSDGVSVVVDFKDLGGGAQSSCVSGGSTEAAALFGAAGFELARVQRQQGFVCRVDGKPTSDPCVTTPPSSAYWGLWWSDGKSGSWTYATTGVDELSIPEGGYVAFSWNSGTRSAPGITPSVHQTQPAEPSPTSRPTAAPTKGTSGGTGSGSGSNGPAEPSTSPTGSNGSTDSPEGSASATPTGQASQVGAGAKPGKKPGRSKSPTDQKSKPTSAPSASASQEAGADDAALATSEVVAPTADESGLPTWVTPVAIVVLFAAAGTAAVVRRRRTTPGP